jgi:1-acyl-sn-glycerol-3-phosphate acyltransferase
MTYIHIPTGFEEATIHSDEADRIYIKNRKGFIKYAIQHGVALVPVYVFGEKRTFSNLQGFWGFRLWLNSFGVPGVCPLGR